MDGNDDEKKRSIYDLRCDQRVLLNGNNDMNEIVDNDSDDFIALFTNSTPEMLYRGYCRYNRI